MEAKKAKKREKMPEQEPKLRIQNFSEVALGYTRENALREASRCLGCKKPACVEGCPVNVQIPQFIGKIKEGDFAGAIRTIKETNALPAVCGRVCPQESQCESKCVLGKKGEPIAVGRLERFAADYELAAGEVTMPEKAKSTGKKVAVVGAGPAGLTVAGELAKRGHEVTIFEALHKAGGVLVYGIPEFRLPKAIVQREVDYVQKLGVKIKAEYHRGPDFDGRRAVRGRLRRNLCGHGRGPALFLEYPRREPERRLLGERVPHAGQPHEGLSLSGIRYAHQDGPERRGRGRRQCGHGLGQGRKRLGANNVYLVYRRSRAEMPARAEEAHHAEEEGIDFRLLTNPIRIIGDDKMWVTGIECIKMSWESRMRRAEGGLSTLRDPSTLYLLKW